MLTERRAVPERAVRWLLLKAVLLYSALLLVLASIVAWLFIHDYGPRAVQTRVSETRIVGRELAARLALEIAPSGAVDPFRLESRRDAVLALVQEALSSLRLVRSLQIRTRAGNVVLEIRVLENGAIDYVLWDRALGGTAPRGPDAPPPFSSLDALGRGFSERFGRGRGVEVAMGSEGDSLVLGTEPGAIEQELAADRRELLARLIAGAAIAIVLIGVAFLYVLRLVHRTRGLEAEAQRANQLAYLGTLASGLAHEIRNPLNAMNINLQLLEEDVASGRISEESRALLHASRAEVLRLERLVKEFLAYARPRPLNRADMSPADLVADVVRFVRPQFTEAEVELHFSVSRAAPSVRVDAEQIRQALLNILRNAMEVSRRGGSVLVRVGSTGQGEASIEIEDRGPGIPEDQRRRIFDVFYSQKPAGSGLGLPIALRAVEAHEGRIEVDSTVGQGSVFRIVLPPALAVDSRGSGEVPLAPATREG